MTRLLKSLGFACGMLLTLAGCQRLGLNQQEEIDADMRYFSIPDAEVEDLESVVE